MVLAAGGYPGEVEKGAVTGFDASIANAKVFHAGTAMKNGDVVTQGGRVLCATALGRTVAEAQQTAYYLADEIRWNGMFMRRDIGWRAIARERANTGV